MKTPFRTKRNHQLCETRSEDYIFYYLTDIIENTVILVENSPKEEILSCYIECAVTKQKKPTEALVMLPFLHLKIVETEKISIEFNVRFRENALTKQKTCLSFFFCI